ncbi:MAG: DUF4386 domain-containing protein [Silvibacterium sp.]|jgi:hypothetical protein
MEQTERKPPRARITGFVYLLYFVAAILAQVLTSRGSSSAGEALNLLADTLYVVVTLLFYRLFRPVSQRLSLTAALFSLAGCAVTVLGQLSLVSSRFSPLIFFAPFCLLLGYLIFRSVFLPRFLGVLLMLAGIAWIIYLVPRLPHFILSSIQALGILAEGLLMLWLIVMGIKSEKWSPAT